MYLRVVKHELRIILLLLVCGTAFVPTPVKGQNREACLECTVDGNRAARDAIAEKELPSSTQASLVTSSDSWTLRKRVDEVTVFFTATDGHMFVSGLTKENIRVTDDRKPAARISAFGYQRDQPLRLGLLVDTSGSVNPQFRFEQQAAIQFLHQVVRLGRDRAFVLGFANAAHMVQDYSDNPEQLAAGVMALHNGGGTALFDAIHSACDKLAGPEDSEPTARILIVLSDGDDNNSRITLSHAIDEAQARDVTIYTVDTSMGAVRTEPAQRRGYLALRRLAEETGGTSFSEMNKRQLRKAFAAIEKEMRNRYALSYQPSDLKEDGRFRRIEILAEKSGRRFHVHTRKGYYARLGSSTK